MLDLRLTNRLSDIYIAAERIKVFFKDHALPEKALFEVNLALDELITNIIKHGYPQTEEGAEPIFLRICIEDSVLIIDLEDKGKAFNPLEVPTPDLDADVGERPIGGLGIHFVREIMDDVAYARLGSKNILTMKRCLDREEDKSGEQAQSKDSEDEYQGNRAW